MKFKLGVEMLHFGYDLPISLLVVSLVRIVIHSDYKNFELYSETIILNSIKFFNQKEYGISEK